MKIRIEVCAEDLEDMSFDTVEEFEASVRHQLDNGIISSEGEAGVDWMIEYDLEVVLVPWPAASAS